MFRPMLGVMGRMGRSRLKIGIAAFSLLAANAVGVGGARAAPLDLQYDAYAAGFPAVTLRFQLEESEHFYRIRGELRTNGIADWLMRYRMEVESGGMVLADRLKPADYAMTSTYHGKRRADHLRYAGSAVQPSLTPPLGDGDPKLPQDESADTIDPLTAIFAAGQGFAATGRCDERIKVYDGRRRYDLVLKDEGDEDVPAGFGAFKGRARHCSLEMVKFRGPVSEAQGNPGKKRPTADVWLAAPWPGATPLPVRLDFHSNWGPVSIHLESVKETVKPVATPPGAPATP
jgi:uncharacterized protein DUF3108